MTTQICKTILTRADAIAPKLSAYRRDFHRHAEAGWFEMRTSSLIARRLTELGWEVLTGEAVCKRDARMGVPEAAALNAHYAWAKANGADPEFLEKTRGGMTGVVGILRCGKGPTVAMRFDIDALGVIESDEPTHLPAAAGFASENHGVMHACGHDGHAAIGLGVAEVLAELRDQLHGTIKIIFQPAEEGVRGAKSIVEAGHLDDADYLLASHITGKGSDTDAVVMPGSYGSLATTKYDAIFRGKAAHAGGAPQCGDNVMLAAATAVLNLHAIPRHSWGATRINVGTLHAGSGRNVIADEAKMEIEVRGETTAINKYVSDYAVRVIKSAAEMHGCTCEIRVMGAADSMVSDEVLCRRTADVCREMGLPVTEKLTAKNGGSEDVSYMMNRVQERGGEATFMRLLTRCTGAAHGRTYDFGEDVLANGVKVFCGVAADILG